MTVNQRLIQRNLMKTTKTIFGILTIAAALVVHVQAQSFLTNGLVAYYPFNGNANDASGNGNNGSATDVTYGQGHLGVAGSAASFNGSSSFVYVTNLFSSEPTQITYSIWFKPANQVSLTNAQFYLAGATGYISDSGWDYGVGLNNPNPVWNNGPIIGNYDGFGMYMYRDWANYYYCDITNFLFLSSQWHHVVAVFDGPTMNLYLDGTYQNTMQDYVSGSQGISSLEIGAHNWGSSLGTIYDQYSGLIDDVRVYFRALSSNEVTQLYAYESALPQSFLTNGLVAYYPFNGNGKDSAGTNDMYFITIPPGLTSLASDIVYTNQGTFGSDRFGNAGNSLSFDGTNMFYARSENIINSSIVNNFSMTIWALAQSTNSLGWNSDGCVLLMPIHGSVNYGGGNAGVGIGMNYNTVCIEGHSDNYTPIFLSTGVAVGVWHQIAISCSNSVISCFVDGTFVGRSDQSSSGYALHPSSGDPYAQNEFWIPEGGGVGGMATYNDNGGLDGFARFKGNASNLRIYNCALSSNEVAQLYAYESQATNPPSITGQPQSVTTNAGDNASFSVTACGTEPLSYQWSLNGTNILGATSSTLTISNVTEWDLGSYSVVITNAFGSVASSNATLSMYPFIAGPFTGVVTDWGQNATLSVGAWGTGPLTYQWFDNGAAILNATNQTLNLSSIQFTNAGLYSVVVSSPLGSVTNTPAQVVVNPAGVSLGLYPGVTVSGTVGYTYIIQSTSDLSNTNSWVSVATLTLEEPIQLWVDINCSTSSPTNTQRFYRVMPGQ